MLQLHERTYFPTKHTAVATTRGRQSSGCCCRYVLDAADMTNSTRGGDLPVKACTTSSKVKVTTGGVAAWLLLLLLLLPDDDVTILAGSKYKGKTV